MARSHRRGAFQQTSPLLGWDWVTGRFRTRCPGSVGFSSGPWLCVRGILWGRRERGSGVQEDSRRVLSSDEQVLLPTSVATSVATHLLISDP